MAYLLLGFRPQVNVFHDYSIGRSSPVWKVSDAARRAQRKEHLTRLAKPRKMHPEYLPAKLAIPIITRAAREATPSERIEELARFTPRPPTTETEWRVKPSALNCQPSDRVLELSRPRPLPNGYLPCKTAGEIWKVSPNARKATPSERVEELSKPIIRTIATNLPRSDAFLVSEVAKKAKATDRIIELAQPIVRDYK